jgi:4-alpha-glucanotransferase
MKTDDWGIETEYEDALGKRRKASRATLAALRAAFGAPPASQDHLRLARTDVPWRLPPGAVLRTEAGQVVASSAEAQGQPVKATLAPGVYRLELADGRTLAVLAHPPCCPSPRPGAPGWGFAVQLYALRSRESWGMGDLADLRRLARWTKKLGGDTLLINPLDAVAPVLPQQSSPYFPTSRRFRNPLYLRPSEVPGWRAAHTELADIEAAGRRLNAAALIDRDAVFGLKMQALASLWDRFDSSAALDEFYHQQGAALEEFALWSALAEWYGGDYRTWPEALRDPQSPQVRQFAARAARRVQFHQWLQWLLDQQFGRAAAEIALVDDLPIGFDPGGADAWTWQSLLAPRIDVGAPPDEYNTQGQNWGLPAPIPHRLQAAGYRPLLETLAAKLRHAGGLRIDHVLGLFRLFWIPSGRPPSQGAYVRYPSDELLACVVLQSARAGAFIIGEDLGTVAPHMPKALAERGLLSYRVLWFESQPPAKYPRLALAAVTTHDLPTIAGLWTGSDLAEQRQLGLQPNEAGMRRMREALQALVDLPDDAPLDEVIVRAHQRLAEAPSCLVTATLEDLLAVQRRPNIPATLPDQRPNWCLPLPKSLEALKRDRRALAVAEALDSRRRSP